MLCGTLQLKKFISICCWLNLLMEPMDSEVNCIHFSRLFRKTKPLGTSVVAKVPWPFLFLVRRLQHLSFPSHPLSELPARLLSSQTLLWERTPANPVPIAVSSPRPFTQDCPPLKCCTWLFSPFSHLHVKSRPLTVSSSPAPSSSCPRSGNSGINSAVSGWSLRTHGR